MGRNVDRTSSKKYFVLAQFPYPSGALHMGHVRVYTVADCLARYKLSRGFNVIHPLGWDAFGLPAENAARQRGLDPAVWTRQNIAHMKQRLSELAIDVDWARYELDTSQESYYRWTQWIFAQMFKAGMAYRQEAKVNWDPVDGTVLADEQVSPSGRAWRSGAKVEKRKLPQWYLRITAFAKELLSGLNELPLWPAHVKDMQRGWIGGMHDWLISRQRAWGTPIPIVYCRSCGPVLTIDDQAHPILNSASQSSCPQCGSSDCLPETDTMDTFVDSSWYYLRFLDPHDRHKIVDTDSVRSLMPVDMYIGGIEHAILHLLYARFVHKFLMRQHGLDQQMPEPFRQLLCQGLVLGKTYQDPDTQAYLRPDELVQDENLNSIVKQSGKHACVSWEKMSKSKYNGVEPSDLLRAYGSDVLRLAMLFAAPIENHMHWDEQQFVVGVDRWAKRLLDMAKRLGGSDHTARISKYSRLIAMDLDRCQFHTAIASLMKLSNELQADGGFSPDALKAFSSMLYPFAPSLAAELASWLPDHNSLYDWPLPQDSVAGSYSVQLNGKFLGCADDNGDVESLRRRFGIPIECNAKVISEKHIISFYSRAATTTG
jgi:leucyl-tRNA synthetase